MADPVAKEALEKLGEAVEFIRRLMEEKQKLYEIWANTNKLRRLERRLYFLRFFKASLN